MAKNVKIPIRGNHVDERLEDIAKWKICSRDKKDVVRFFRDLKIGKITGNQIADGTVVSYLTYLKIGLEFMDRETPKLTPKDTEALCEALQKDELQKAAKKRSPDGKARKRYEPFAETGKIKIKNTLILYLEWKLVEKASTLTPILKVKPRLKQPTPDYLSEVQIEKLYRACRTNEERFLIAVLFDSGARAEEFHNIRKEDIELPKANENFVRLTLKEEYSKTKGRVISLYWKHSLEAVRDYVEERIKQGIMPSDPVFKRSYSGARKFLYRLGQVVLSRHTHYHLFRHSSATHYADKMNRQELCIRYGWRFSSPMPDIYISRVGMESKQLDEKFTATELEDLRIKLEKQEQQNRILAEWKEKLEKDLEKRKQLDPVMNQLLSNPEVLRVIAKGMAELGLIDKFMKASHGE